MLDEDLENADVIFSVSKLSLHVDDEPLTHLDLGETRLEFRHFWVLCGWGRQVSPSLYPKEMVQQDPVLEAAQEVSDRHLELLQLLIDYQGV